MIVTYPDALFEKVITKRALEQTTFKVSVGEHLSLDFINEALFEFGFNRVDFVTEPGDFQSVAVLLMFFLLLQRQPLSHRIFW